MKYLLSAFGICVRSIGLLSSVLNSDTLVSFLGLLTARIDKVWL